MTTLIDTIRSSVIGTDAVLAGPFGRTPLVFADYTASGRSLSFIEDYLRAAVLPMYANTHTESSGTGLQTTRLREEAREIVRRCVGAAEEHAVIFCGTGSTGAINKFIGMMELRRVRGPYECAVAVEDPDSRPVVFIGPYEHHSNELPWRESVAEVVVIEEDSDGQIDIAQLGAALDEYRDRPLKIGSFSASSNVTGIISDTGTISRLLHKNGALALWDFAAAAPYVPISMGSSSDPDGDFFDAVFISPHKFVGGPGTPGLLIARRQLFSNPVPDTPGGGTVSFVNAHDQVYLFDVEHREEGGTPDIVGAIRCGLVFQLKDSVGIDEIVHREHDYVSAALDRWSAHPRIQILGSRDAARLAIVSFNILYGSSQTLHHNLVVSMLNDLFGVQARGGCSCAGPYGHRLLNISDADSDAFLGQIDRGFDGIKPGWVRVNFNYFIDDETFEYIVRAVELIADHAETLLTHYRFDPRTGLWSHVDAHDTVRNRLSDISYRDGVMQYPDQAVAATELSLADRLREVETALQSGDSVSFGRVSPTAPPSVDESFERLRWFPYPAEAPE